MLPTAGSLGSAAAEPLIGLQDARLQPCLLLHVIAQHLPSEGGREKVDLGDIAMAADIVRRHHLLQEPPAASIRMKQKPARQVAIDQWCTRVMELANSSDMERPWAGAALLGVTSRECSRQRFLDFRELWGPKLISLLKVANKDPSRKDDQPTVNVLPVRSAACASLTDYFSRLGELLQQQAVKKEVIALAGKAWSPLLLLLQEDMARSAWGQGLDLLATLMTFFPGGIKREADAIEKLIVQHLTAPMNSEDIHQKCIRCFALLPRLTGDPATWSSLCRRLLLAIHSELDVAFKGMEDESVAASAAGSLHVPGSDGPPQLAGMPDGSDRPRRGEKGFWTDILLGAEALLGALQHLLATPCPAPAPLASSATLALVARVLRVDGALVGPTGERGREREREHQVALCAQLPALHAAALRLLLGLLQSARTQLLPLASDVARLLGDCFKRSHTSVAVRMQLFSIAGHLVLYMGAGMVSVLAPLVVCQALSELSGHGTRFSPRKAQLAASKGSSPFLASAAMAESRKRKEAPQGGGGGGREGGRGAAGGGGGDGDRLEAPRNPALECAALEALEAVLIAGGSLLPERWRLEVDSAIVTTAMAVIGRLGSSMPGGSPSERHLARLQLAACRALSASVLAASTHRPPYLGQALSIFRRGKSAAGTELSYVCSTALLAIEPMLHPRCLPFAPHITSIERGGSSSEAALGGSALPSQISPNGASKYYPLGAGPASTRITGANDPAAVLQDLAVDQDPWTEVDLQLFEDLGPLDLDQEADIAMDGGDGGGEVGASLLGGSERGIEPELVRQRMQSLATDSGLLPPMHGMGGGAGGAIAGHVGEGGGSITAGVFGGEAMAGSLMGGYGGWGGGGGGGDPIVGGGYTNGGGLVGVGGTVGLMGGGGVGGVVGGGGGGTNQGTSESLLPGLVAGLTSAGLVSAISHTLQGSLDQRQLGGSLQETAQMWGVGGGGRESEREREMGVAQGQGRQDLLMRTESWKRRRPQSVTPVAVPGGRLAPMAPMLMENDTPMAMNALSLLPTTAMSTPMTSTITTAMTASMATVSTSGAPGGSHHGALHYSEAMRANQQQNMPTSSFDGLAERSNRTGGTQGLAAGGSERRAFHSGEVGGEGGGIRPPPLAAGQDKGSFSDLLGSHQSMGALMSSMISNRSDFSGVQGQRGRPLGGHESDSDGPLPDIVGGDTDPDL